MLESLIGGSRWLSKTTTSVRVLADQPTISVAIARKVVSKAAADKVAAGSRAAVVSRAGIKVVAGRAVANRAASKVAAGRAVVSKVVIRVDLIRDKAKVRMAKTEAVRGISATIDR